MNSYERQERSRKVAQLLDGEIFGEVWDALYSRYLEELMKAPLGELTGTVAHAKLKALQELKADLESIRNDDKFYETLRKKPR